MSRQQPPQRQKSFGEAFSDLLSSTATAATSVLKKKTTGLFHDVSREELKIGDHIYIYGSSFAFSHHGIVVMVRPPLSAEADSPLIQDGGSSGSGSPPKPPKKRVKSSSSSSDLLASSSYSTSTLQPEDIAEAVKSWPTTKVVASYDDEFDGTGFSPASQSISAASKSKSKSSNTDTPTSEAPEDSGGLTPGQQIASSTSATARVTSGTIRSFCVSKFMCCDVT